MCAQCDLEVVEFSFTVCLFAAEAHLNGFLPGVTRDMASIFGNDYSRRVAIDIVISLPSARQVFKRWPSPWLSSCTSQEGCPYQLRERYLGEWSKGQREGRGTFYFASGSRRCPFLSARDLDVICPLKDCLLHVPPGRCCMVGCRCPLHW